MKIEFEEPLWTKVKRYAETAGYSSPEEFVQHAVERQMGAAGPEAGQEEDRRAATKLKGLGYMDFGRDI
jgi:hypothetical protein